jgi:hypothetical protein
VFWCCLKVCRSYGASGSSNPLAHRSPTVRKLDVFDRACGMRVVRAKYASSKAVVQFTYSVRTCLNNTVSVRLTHFHCKMGVLASYGTHSFPTVYPELMTEHLGPHLAPS